MKNKKKIRSASVGLERTAHVAGGPRGQRRDPAHRDRVGVGLRHHPLPPQHRPDLLLCSQETET